MHLLVGGLGGNLLVELGKHLVFIHAELRPRSLAHGPVTGLVLKRDRVPNVGRQVIFPAPPEPLFRWPLALER